MTFGVAQLMHKQGDMAWSSSFMHIYEPDWSPPTQGSCRGPYWIGIVDKTVASQLDYFPFPPNVTRGCTSAVDWLGNRSQSRYTSEQSRRNVTHCTILWIQSQGAALLKVKDFFGSKNGKQVFWKEIALRKRPLRRSCPGPWGLQSLTFGAEPGTFCVP